MKSYTEKFTHDLCDSGFPSKVLAIPQKYSDDLLDVERYCHCNIKPMEIGHSLGNSSINDKYLIHEIEEVYPTLNEMATVTNMSPEFRNYHNFKTPELFQNCKFTRNPFGAVDGGMDFNQALFSQSSQAPASGIDSMTVLDADNQGIELDGQQLGKRLSNLTKSKLNMKLLQDYNCSIQKRKNPKGGITTVYICNYGACNKEFTRSWSIIDHVRMHEGVRPYKCKFCDKSYTQKGNMLKHMKRHTDPSVNDRRSYECQFCSKKYTEKYNLKTHQKKFHPFEIQQFDPQNSLN
ncbi:unnamed protein product [Moneuplotes crassus]|uniref:C2H2-type domain-containing protein n=1 Tax=Euplotes crassus TaxID=5936 RepID=A0AAD1XMG2_EUPCR|nr:unnamed protein product [Moneuplotes crassus]